MADSTTYTRRAPYIEGAQENYIDLLKAENKQQKFVDKFIGICLKYSNIKNNLVTLYSTNAGMRKHFR